LLDEEEDEDVLVEEELDEVLVELLDEKSKHLNATELLPSAVAGIIPDPKVPSIAVPTARVLPSPDKARLLP
jgi:hypothetical protein